MMIGRRRRHDIRIAYPICKRILGPKDEVILHAWAPISRRYIVSLFALIIIIVISFGYRISVIDALRPRTEIEVTENNLPRAGVKE